MKFIKENKKLIVIIGSVLILLSLLVVFLVNNKTEDDTSLNYEENYYLKDYKVNELVPVNINDEQVARKYLAEYTKLIFNDPERAYNLIEPKYKEIKFKDFDDFKKYFDNKIDGSFFNANIEQLGINNTNSYKEFYIKDSSNNTYIFREYSIMNYEVLFDNYTV